MRTAAGVQGMFAPSVTSWTPFFASVVASASRSSFSVAHGRAMSQGTSQIDPSMTRVARSRSDALAWAVESGRFGSIETSVNLADQHSAHSVLPRARERGLGVIAKRPIANAVWQFEERPAGQYAETYWERLHQLDLNGVREQAGLDWAEFALRFTAYQPNVHSAIVGTANIANLERNVRIIQEGPLRLDVLTQIEAAWERTGKTWPGEV